MGVTYKLLPKTREFILQQKKKEPQISCRKISALAKEKLGLNLSKSSINALLKMSALSSPVGRRRKKRRTLHFGATKNLGAFFLKAADLDLGFSGRCAYLVQKRFPKLKAKGIGYKNEVLLYQSVFGISTLEELKSYDEKGLWALVGKKYSSPPIEEYLELLLSQPAISLWFTRELLHCLKEIQTVKLLFKDNSVLYLDGQLRSVWSVPETSGEFSATVTKLKIYLKNVFLDDQQPLILLACGGYASISKEMLELIAAFQNRGEKLLNNLILMGAIRENFPLGQPKAIARALVFGIFPWQFTRTKKLSIDTSWETFLFGPSQEKYFFAEGSILLTQPKINKQISLRAVFLKKSLQSEVELIVATTYAEDQKSAADILESYLYRWPEPLDSYQDYLKKIEYATYTDLSKLNITKQLQETFISRELKENLKFALEKLSLYAQKYFFPLGYRGLKFEDLKEKFYNLSGWVRKSGKNIVVVFEPPGKDFLLTEDLAYACNRVNESGIYTTKNERVWFSIEGANFR